MNYMYVCPRCKSTYGVSNRSEGKACGDCNIQTVFTGYDEQGWYSKSKQQRDAMITEIIGVNESNTSSASGTSHNNSFANPVMPTSLNPAIGAKKRYKAIAGPKDIHVERGNTQAAFDMLSDIINRETAGGWEYHSMETITVSESSGCLGQNTISTYYYMLIFSHDVE